MLASMPQKLIFTYNGALLRYCFGQKTSMTDKVYLTLLPFASLALLVSMPQNWQVKVYSVLQSPTSLVMLASMPQKLIFTYNGALLRYCFGQKTSMAFFRSISFFRHVYGALLRYCHRFKTIMTVKVNYVLVTRRALQCLYLYRKIFALREPRYACI